MRPHGRVKRRLTRIAVATVAVALAAMTAVFYVVLSRSLEADAYNVLVDRAAAVAVTLTRSGTALTADLAGEETLDAGTWIYDPAGRLVERPPGDAAVPAAVTALARADHPTRTERADLVLYALPVGDATHRTAVVVAAQPRRPFEAAEDTALTAALALDGVVVATMAALTWRTVTAALAPVSRMTATAAAWNAQDLTQRFRLGPPTDELTTLAGTLDDLLDRLAASLGHERRLTAEIAHELRTPLARMRAEAEVALRGSGATHDLRAALSTVVDDTEHLTTTVDALMRSAADRVLTGRELPAGCDLAVAVRLAVLQAVGPADAAALTVTYRIDDRGVEAAAEQGLVVRLLAPLVHNAARYGAGELTVTIGQDGREALVTLDDAGPGLTDDDCRHGFTPGWRGSAAGATASDGVGLGLALARRLARSAAGDVDARPAGPGDPGGHLQVRLPLLPPAGAGANRVPGPRPDARRER